MTHNNGTHGIEIIKIFPLGVFAEITNCIVERKLTTTKTAKYLRSHFISHQILDIHTHWETS